MNDKNYRGTENEFWAHYNALPTEKWLNLRRPATKVRVLEWGQGQPILFLHGGPAAASIFAPLASLLTDFSCIVLDRPGCGLSPAIDYRHARLDDLMADIVLSCIDALALRRISIVTSSFGGACAFWFVQRHPERVSRLAHLGCPAFVSQMQLPFMMKLLASPGLGYAAARLPMNHIGTLSFMRTMGQQQAIAKNLLPDVFINWWISLARDTATMRNDRELIRKGLTWRGMRPELVLSDEAIQRLEQPNYFYWGQDEPFATSQFARELVNGMKKGEIDMIPESGHLPWFDDPQAAAARIRNFMRQADPGEIQ